MRTSESLDQLNLSALSDEEVAALIYEAETEEKTLCENDYYNFFIRAWEEIEPETPYKDNWHIQYLCSILQKEMERIAAGKPKTRDIIINIPPGSSKSRLCTVFPCAWAWTKWPWMRFINNSYSAGISTKHCMDSRRVINSDWYQARWGSSFDLTTDQDQKSWFENNKGGFRISSSNGSKVTGVHAHIITNDDPQNPMEAESEAERQKAIDHNNQTLWNRVIDARIALRIIIQQRLNEGDLTGNQMASNPNGYLHICIPAEETDFISPPELRKFYVGGLFFPTRFSRETLDEARLPTNLGERGYAGQMLQRPAPLEGNMFKRQNWNFWKYPGTTMPAVTIRTPNGPIDKIAIDLPPNFDEKIQGWDMAFKDTAGSDRVSGQCWARSGPSKFCLDNDTRKMDYPATVAAVRGLYSRHRGISGILIEDKANGPAVISDLSREIPGIIPQPADASTGGKTARAMPMARQQEAGNIYLPHPALCPWVWEYIESFANFPDGKYLDEIDCAAHCVNKLSDNKKRVISCYNPHSSNRAAYTIHWDRVSQENKLYVSVWLKEDFRLGIVSAFWDSENNVLYAYDSYTLESPLAESVMLVFRNQMVTLGMSKTMPMQQFEWYGNDEMFGTKDDQDSVSDGYMKYQVYINENSTYDEMASIMQTNQLFLRHKIIVHTRCEGLNHQLNEWCVENGRPESLGARSKFDNAEVLALCNISNMLVETKKIKVEKPGEYSKRKSEFIDAVAGVRDEDGYAALAHGTVPIKSNDNVNEWMKI